MGYPDDALAADEELLLHRHPHWKMLLLPAITFLLATAAAGFLAGLAQSRLEGAARTVALLVVLAGWLGIVGWRCVGTLVSWKSTHFIITDRRVLIRHGVITHTGIDIPLGRISNVQFRHGLLDRMLRTGTLVIVSAADDPLEFEDIPDVQRVHSLLYHQVFDSTYLDPGENPGGAVDFG
ncbi:PH domain-containing protein [Rhodococcus tukisamuensis]|uniref:Membrane protein YdbS, contains bPH2 (Pleckstrin homology) domain n=1 Tax=Rhodococcus tukisamuensis TaxID=168276 RepID=A0A1G6YDU9_9NOCA|nr:PH domain-containing protein [Rhodococcus tukisamuensis]SDD87756.1 membrane protein YdbS, contains bPH2 (pleckstrin homology) domain [Rhodococcus tukisamuensis]